MAFLSLSWNSNCCYLKKIFRRFCMIFQNVLENEISSFVFLLMMLALFFPIKIAPKITEIASWSYHQAGIYSPEWKKHSSNFTSVAQKSGTHSFSVFFFKHFLCCMLLHFRKLIHFKHPLVFLFKKLSTFEAFKWKGTILLFTSKPF